MAQHYLFLLLMLAVTTEVRSQLDSHGFLNIDCGLYRVSSYVDSDNGLTYLSDEKFIDTGVNSNISSSIIAQYGDTYFREYLTVRYFPTGSRNCYTLKPLTVGLNYLIRATFFYGNYDSLKEPPIFDVYLGVDHWETINATIDRFPEMIFTATADFVQVCLVNKKQGTPFISSLHLRQFKSGMYAYVNSSTSLVLVRRNNFGGRKLVTRYDDDIYDRWWYNDTLNTAWTNISTSSKLNYSDPDFEVPAIVMQTAVATSSIKIPLSFTLSTDQSTKYCFFFHIYEIETPLTGRRELDLFSNGEKIFNEPIIPSAYPGFNYWLRLVDSGHKTYNLSLVATSNSTLPPLLNAFEQYTFAPVGISTYAQDVAAINIVKEYHKIKKGWSGDPCLPIEFLWSGIICSTDSSNTERITSLNLSSSNLTGSLSDSIGNLTALQYLYLSNNSLSGSLPSSLDSLTSLKLLDIRGNSHISTILPPELESKRQSGFLEYRYGDIIPPPSPSPPKKNTMIIAIAVAVPVFVIAVVITVVLVLKRQKYKKTIIALRENESHPPSPPPIDHANIYPTDNPVWKPQPRTPEQIFPKRDNLKFSYSDLKRITNNFNINIGTGGYGSVFLGNLENGFQVAVKMLSQSSTQGFKEFLAEAENLARVHHKNLVLLIGYCTDNNCMALVYEYMQNGSLQNKLKDNAAPLSWKQRLEIAYESAQGLEYLHNSCNPPLIHRDVKTSNILLNTKFEAKIADFGLARAFDNNMVSRVSTRVVGTVGYMDPEYYLSNQLSTKSDVYSFGVVLLEIITGRPPIVSGIEGGNLVQWVRHKLSGGYVESIVDPNIRGKYDINSVWKVADLACKCTESTSSRRPTMSAVVTELKESMDLEISMEQIHVERTDNFSTDISQNSTIEMATFMPMAGPNMR